MRRIPVLTSIGLAVSLLAASAAGQSSRPSPPPTVRVEQRDIVADAVGLRIRLPEPWIRFDAPQPDSLSHLGAVAMRHPDTGLVLAFVQMRTHGLTPSVLAERFHARANRTGETRIAGLPAAWRESDSGKTTVIVDGDDALVVICMSVLGRFDQHRATYDALLAAARRP